MEKQINQEGSRKKTRRLEEKNNKMKIIIFILVVLLVSTIVISTIRTNREKNTLHFPEEEIIELDEFYSGMLFSGDWMIYTTFENELNTHGTNNKGDDTNIPLRNGIVFSLKKRYIFSQERKLFFKGNIYVMKLPKHRDVIFVKNAIDMFVEKFGLDNSSIYILD